MEKRINTKMKKKFEKWRKQKADEGGKKERENKQINRGQDRENSGRHRSFLNLLSEGRFLNVAYKEFHICTSLI